MPFGSCPRSRVSRWFRQRRATVAQRGTIACPPVSLIVMSPTPGEVASFWRSNRRRETVPTYLSPGVYVEETDSGSRPIEGVGTAVAAFVGLAEKGPVNTPTRLSSWTQYSTIFGAFVPNTFLPHAVYSYFLNGGGSCYVVRITGGEEPKGTNAGATIAAEPDKPGYRIEALSPGGDANGLSV